MKRNLFILILIIIVSLNSFADTYNHAVIQGIIEQEIGEHIVTKIYTNLGHDIKISRLPGTRAAKESSSGTKDGEIMRVYVFGNAYPTLIRIPTPYYEFGLTGFIRKDSNVKINSKEDLKNYRVGFNRGVKIAANLAEGAKSRTETNNTDQLFRMLNSGRIDVAIVTDVDGILATKKLGLSNIIEIDEALIELEAYHYVHEKNRDIADEIDNEIKRMKQTGELDKLAKKAENTVFNSHLK